MEYQQILEEIKRNLRHEDFSSYLDEEIEKMIENNGFSQNLDNIYGFYISFDDCSSISIDKDGNFEFSCEQNIENGRNFKKVMLEKVDNKCYSLQYYDKVEDNDKLNKNTIFETLIYDKGKLVHARCEKNGISTTVLTSEIGNYNSYFQQDKFNQVSKKRQENEKIRKKVF